MGKSNIEYEQVIDRGCGLDVHRDTVVATVMGKGIKTETRTFGTTTSSLNELGVWLESLNVTDGAMESTGIYWKPVLHVLRAYPLNLIVVNARHIKNVPGRKTDKADSQWICKLLISGLLKGSFIPPENIQELRDLHRYKKKLIGTVAYEKNRIIGHKILSASYHIIKNKEAFKELGYEYLTERKKKNRLEYLKR